MGKSLHIPLFSYINEDMWSKELISIMCKSLHIPLFFYINERLPVASILSHRNFLFFIFQ